MFFAVLMMICCQSGVCAWRDIKKKKDTQRIKKLLQCLQVLCRGVTKLRGGCVELHYVITMHDVKKCPKCNGFVNVFRKEIQFIRLFVLPL